MKSGKLWIPVLLFFWLSCIASAGHGEDNKLGTLTGQAVGEDAMPIVTGVVSFFTADKGPPIDRGAVRRVPNLVVRIEQGGRFKANLPAGSYYVGVLQREIGKGPGPPRPGEKFFFVLDEADELRVITVQAGKTVDAGLMSGAIPHIISDPDRYFNVRGTVRHEDGQPFAGAYVTAKKYLSTSRPQFISSPTDATGRYSILLPPGEPFFLVALENVRGGRPRVGSHAGSYGGQSPVPTEPRFNIYSPVVLGPERGYAAGRPISGKSGELREGIDIIMYKVLAPEQIRSEMLNKTREQPQE